MSLLPYDPERNPLNPANEFIAFLQSQVHILQTRVAELTAPIPMILHCPDCSYRHVDKGEFSTKPHHTHACQACGMVWRPALVPTVGVQFLPGFKDNEEI